MKRQRLIDCGVALLLLVLAAGPAVAKGLTHLGQPIENHIVLNWVAPGDFETPCTPNREFRQAFPDGTLATEAFVVPTGMILVVTDVDATIVAGVGNTFPQGRSVYAVVTSETLGGSVHAPHATAGVLITNTVSQSVKISSNLGAGALIGADQQVCLRGESISASSGFLSFDVTLGTVRGYLIEE